MCTTLDPQASKDWVTNNPTYYFKIHNKIFHKILGGYFMYFFKGVNKKIFVPIPYYFKTGKTFCFKKHFFCPTGIPKTLYFVRPS